jgi:anaerobic magnesium-protoporphyrin IX monomethyl ester cyclase
MRVLIVSPKAKTGGLESLRKGNQILQGALYVAAAARDADHQVKVVIADSKDLEQFIQKYEPQVIGFSCVSSTYIIARDMIRLTKESHPKIKTIIGGHHATFLYKDVIEESGVDYVCRGEGEEAFPALLAALERGEEHPRIPGIVFLHDNEYHNDDVIALLDDIEALPQIERDLVDEAFSFTPKIVSSRGCPFHCSFCSISAFYGGRYRQRSVDSVISDIKRFVSWGHDTFWFHDDNLTVDTAWVNSFCNRLRAEKLKINYNCMSRVDSIVKNPQMIANMADTGCRLVSIGIESGIEEVLKRMNKKISTDQIKEAIGILNKLKISHNWYMILGSADEFDSPRYIEQNIRFFSSLPLGYVLISILTPFPGTALFEKLEGEGRIRHRNWQDFDVTHCVYEPQGMSYRELEAYLPKAYLRIYLSKGWRLIPLFISSFRQKAIRPAMIGYALKAMFCNVVLKKDFSKAIRKHN